MNKQEIANGISPIVMEAFINRKNIETGFLTGHPVNEMSKEQLIRFSMETEKIINKMTLLLKQLAGMNVPTNQECGQLFQYVFEKVTEAAYKLLMGDCVDTQFNLNEAFDYFEPDVPKHVLQKLTDVVYKTGRIHLNILHYLEENDAKTINLDSWMPPYLMAAVAMAIQFAQEIGTDEEDDDLGSF
ncbi:MAG: hypothetical protein J6X70_03225 [Muribaculaceae bacterium]|nr:hypothetical protein [Muribaculaceae bacterium]